MGMSLVSIIIPAYNAERTIGMCIESLLHQALKDLEIIIVDDGSTDVTGRIADDYAKKDSRIKVIHQANAGAYTARLAGMERSSAPFLAFIDADDAVEPEMYADLLKFATDNKLDIAQCECVGSPLCGANDELILSRQDVLDKVVNPRLIEGSDAVSVWDKLYLKASLRFPFKPSNIMMFDDLAFNLQAFLGVSRVGYLRKGLYRYNVNAGSSVRNFRMKNIEDLKEALHFRNEFIPLYGVDVLKSTMDNWICRNVKNMWKVACTAPIRDGVARSEKINALLDLPEVRAAFADTGRVGRLRAMHNPIVVSAMGFARGLKGLLG